jgi:hypothetical protein
MNQDNFNIDEFNNFFEAQHNKERKEEHEIKYKTEQKQIKKEFNKQYPTAFFFFLRRQRYNCRTDDACIQYRHILTNNIYSWNYSLNKWTRNSKMNKQTIADLFKSVEVEQYGSFSN